MPIRNSSESYGAGAKLIHWLSAALVATAWLIGFGFDFIPKEGPARPIAGLAHITIGQTVALLLIARLAWRLLDPPPPPPVKPGLPQKIVLILLYVLLLAVPLVGVTMIFSSGHELRLFGFFHIPSPLTENKPLHDTLKEAHELLAHSLVGLAALHAGVALFHHFKLRDATLRRMLPFARVS
jgi:cytochrome b561